MEETTKLRKIIDKHELTGYKIAKQLGLKSSPSTRIYNIVDGKTIVRVPQIVNIIEAINELVDTNYTLSDVGMSPVTVKMV